MQSDLLDRPADAKTVLDLYSAGLLNLEAKNEALSIVRPPSIWWF